MWRILRIFPLLAAMPLTAAGGASSAEGHQVLESQKCVSCHRFGPQWSPDLPPTLVKLLRTPLTPGRLAAEMWNHAPLMWTAIETRGQPFPELSQQQADSLIAYFFAAGYFDAAGDARRGERVFTDGGCHVCHLMDSPGGGGAAVAEWNIGNVTDLLRGMWSHWPAMNAAMGRRRLVWPAISAGDMGDLLAFVRSRFPDKLNPEIRPGSPESGRLLFERKGCAACHQGDMSVSQYPHVRTFTELAASFWNHIPMMTRKPETVSGAEMADLVAYLWSIRYFEEAGSARRGQRVFQAKQCARCHPARPHPDFRAASLIAALWKHPPAVVAKMKRDMILWPTFLPGEVDDLIAFYRTTAR